MSFVGKRIKIVNPGMTFGDYGPADTAVVIGEEPVGVIVRWDKRRFVEDTLENDRCTLVAYREFEVVEED